MAMPSSGAASTADIQAEFGTPTAGNTSMLYRGGSYVPDISANNSVPTSGAADTADYYSATAYVPMSTPTLNRTSSTVKSASLHATAYTLWSAVFTCSQPSGGIGPYSYYWEHVSGGSVFGYTDRDGASTQFGRTTQNSDYSGVYRCKVTDSTGASVYSGNVTIRLVHYDVHESNIQSVSHTTSHTGTAVAQIEIRRNGEVWKLVGSTYSKIGDWVAPKSSTVGDDFEIYINNDDTGISGANSNVDLTSPSLSTWGQINVTRYAEESNTSAGYTEICGVRIRIRMRAAAGSNQETYPIDKIIGLTAKKNSAPPPPPPPPPPWPPTVQIN